jgi:hypothetical protein
VCPEGSAGVQLNVGLWWGESMAAENSLSRSSGSSMSRALPPRTDSRAVRQRVCSGSTSMSSATNGRSSRVIPVAAMTCWRMSSSSLGTRPARPAKEARSSRTSRRRSRRGRCLSFTSSRRSVSSPSAVSTPAMNTSARPRSASKSPRWVSGDPRMMMRSARASRRPRRSSSWRLSSSMSRARRSRSAPPAFAVLLGCRVEHHYMAVPGSALSAS